MRYIERYVGVEALDRIRNLQRSFKNYQQKYSMMAFEEHEFEERMNPQVDVKEVSERDCVLFTELMVAIFEMPREWMDSIDSLFKG